MATMAGLDLLRSAAVLDAHHHEGLTPYNDGSKPGAVHADDTLRHRTQSLFAHIVGGCHIHT